jgi:hypothetical protein
MKSAEACCREIHKGAKKKQTNKQKNTNVCCRINNQNINFSCRINSKTEISIAG